MQFPPFKLLHWFIDNNAAKYNISLSDMLPATFQEVDVRLEDLSISENFVNGRPELRALIAQQHASNPENVLITSSCSEANLDVCAALLKPGDEAIVVMPNYPPLRDIPVGLGAKVRQLRLKAEDGFTFRVEDLKRAVTQRTKLVILTNVNNPTSSVVNADQIEDISGLADRRRFHVLWDETFRELAFGKKPPTAANYGERMIVTSTMSKVYGMGGLRLGWIIASGSALSRIKNVTEYNTVGPSGISDRIALSVLSDRDRFIERARNIIRHNRPIVEDWVQRNERVGWVDHGVGNVAFLKVRADVDRLADVLLNEYGTIIAPGRFFGVKGHFRLGFGRKGDDLTRGLENFDRALKSMT